LFPQAATSSELLTWTGATGQHVLRVIQPSPDLRTFTESASTAEPAIDDFGTLPADGPSRVPATVAASETASSTFLQRAVSPSSIEAGVLVHRALATGSDDLDTLLRDAERSLIEDVPALITRARSALDAIRHQPEVSAIFAANGDVTWRRHEVPFSLRRPDDPTIIRGTIDCVVQRGSGVIEVIEFKTGQPTAEHQQQLAIYVEAARALFPDTAVEGRLIYAG
jgi:ATP-dependent exoDNAse (exonuclease V) beta subunit